MLTHTEADAIVLPHPSYVAMESLCGDLVPQIEDVIFGETSRIAQEGLRQLHMLKLWEH